MFDIIIIQFLDSLEVQQNIVFLIYNCLTFSARRGFRKNPNMKLLKVKWVYKATLVNHLNTKRNHLGLKMLLLFLLSKLFYLRIYMEIFTYYRRLTLHLIQYFLTT